MKKTILIAGMTIFANLSLQGCGDSEDFLRACVNDTNCCADATKAAAFAGSEVLRIQGGGTGKPTVTQVSNSSQELPDAGSITVLQPSTAQNFALRTAQTQMRAAEAEQTRACRNKALSCYFSGLFFTE